MNVVTFNQHIDAMVENRRKCDAAFTGWRTAPLFDYTTNYEREQAVIMANKHLDAFAVTPFPVFRFNVTATDTEHPEWGKYRAKALVGHAATHTGILARVDSLMETEETYGLPKTLEAMTSGLPLYLLLSDLKYVGQTTLGSDYRYQHLFGMKGRWLDVSEINMLGELPTMYLDGFLKSLGTFLIDCMQPSTHIARVHPAQPHRSVEWIQARTHYTLITHGHPANRKTVNEGERVTSDAKGELTRMSGARREHWRIYRHERYRFMRGQKQLIKETWVGPKIWKDEGGNQIYRILEPVTNTLTVNSP